MNAHGGERRNEPGILSRGCRRCRFPNTPGMSAGRSSYQAPGLLAFRCRIAAPREVEKHLLRTKAFADQSIAGLHPLTDGNMRRVRRYLEVGMCVACHVRGCRILRCQPWPGFPSTRDNHVQAYKGGTTWREMIFMFFFFLRRPWTKVTMRRRRCETAKFCLPGCKVQGVWLLFSA